jgi:TonB family protein
MEMDKFTFPPITVLRPTQADTCRELPEAEVWLEFQFDPQGKPTQVRILWCSVDDTTFEATARQVVESQTFSKTGNRWNSSSRLRHVVHFRRERKDVCELSGTTADTTVAFDQPIMVYQGFPEYPSSAKSEGMTGTVWIKCLVNERGTVSEAVVHKSSYHPDLDKSALLASYRNTFSPGLRNGKPVAIWVTYRVDFKLTH